MAFKAARVTLRRLAALSAPGLAGSSGTTACRIAAVGVADKLPGSQANCHHLAGSISEGRTSSRFPVVSTSFQDVRTRSMFIQTMKTPNPSSLMFVPGQTVMETGAADFTTMKEAMASPLARKLFAIEGVKGVFYGSDFITITKSDEVDWAELKPQAFAAIMDHFSSGAQLMVSTEHDDNAIHDDDDEVVAMIKELLETRIRPAVAEDGGDIAFKSFDPESGTVTLKMKGACSGCPSSSVTLKSGIENMLMHYIPEVKQVIEDETLDVAESAGLSEFEKLEAKLSN
mmetsp:Transcript_40248/g.113977  ORF Transcript_40248/g.113977 Transcript_40248/m.113977 type:complete len:286 (+) Transcript_40248:231-1088(+)